MRKRPILLVAAAAVAGIGCPRHGSGPAAVRRWKPLDVRWVSVAGRVSAIGWHTRARRCRSRCRVVFRQQRVHADEGHPGRWAAARLAGAPVCGLDPDAPRCGLRANATRGRGVRRTRGRFRSATGELPAGRGAGEHPAPVRARHGRGRRGRAPAGSTTVPPPSMDLGTPPGATSPVATPPAPALPPPSLSVEAGDNQIPVLPVSPAVPGGVNPPAPPVPPAPPTGLEGRYLCRRFPFRRSCPRPTRSRSQFRQRSGAHCLRARRSLRQRGRVAPPAGFCRPR